MIFAFLWEYFHKWEKMRNWMISNQSLKKNLSFKRRSWKSLHFYLHPRNWLIIFYESLLHTSKALWQSHYLIIVLSLKAIKIKFFRAKINRNLFYCWVCKVESQGKIKNKKNNWIRFHWQADYLNKLFFEINNNRFHLTSKCFKTFKLIGWPYFTKQNYFLILIFYQELNQIKIYFFNKVKITGYTHLYILFYKAKRWEVMKRYLHR